MFISYEGGNAAWPPNMFEPGMFISNEGGNAACPGRKGGEGPSCMGVFVFSVTISGLNEKLGPTEVLSYWHSSVCQLEKVLPACARTHTYVVP